MRPSIEAFSGLAIIILGVLFFFYLPPNYTNVIGDAVFIGAGYLLIRRAYGKNKRALAEVSKKNVKKQRPKPKGR